MAKSKTKKSKVKPVDDDELQVKSRDEAMEDAEDAEPVAKSKTKKSKVQPVDDDDDLQVKSRDEATEDAEPVDEVAEDTELAEDADPVEEVAEDTELADAEAEEIAEDADAEGTELDADDAEAGADDFKLDDDEEPVAEKVDADAAADAEPPADEDEDEEDSIDEGPKAPPAKISKLAMTLILLNWIAAPTFLVFAYLDHAERTKYSYRTLLNYVQVLGLPLKSEEPGIDNSTPLAGDTRPYLNLSSEQLTEIFKKRPGVDKKALTGGVTFAPFEETPDKRVPYRLRPSDMKILELKTDVFQGVLEPVDTLDDEIDRLQKDLPKDIDKAVDEAKETLAKMSAKDKLAMVKRTLLPFTWDTAQAKKLADSLDAKQGAELDALAKRTVVRNVLFPIAWDVWQVKKLNERLDNTKDADLDAFVDEAVQRRIYYDILAPINAFRPGDLSDVKNYKVEMLSDLDKYKSSDVQEFLQQRLKASIADKQDLDVHFGKAWSDNGSKDSNNRESIEKRQKIAFILFALSQVNVPVVDRKLYDKGIERAQIISGLYDFTNASIYYVRALRVLEERIGDSILADRQGSPVTVKGGKGALTSTAGFTDEYNEWVNRLVEIEAIIDGANKRLKDIKGQKDELQKTYEQRAGQHKEALDKLIEARGRTETYIKELEEKQAQLHNALIELSEAGDRNFRLYQEIYAIEMRFIEKSRPKKGKKTP